MTLVLERQSETRIPVEVRGIVPDQLIGLSTRKISQQKIWLGRQQLELGELFRVSGQIADDHTMRWTGDLEAVHWIGAGMQVGQVEIETSAGRYVGSQMSGGTVVAAANVSDFSGAEMTGGTIRIAGNAGDCVGGNFSGEKVGMNRGEILITGNAGRGCGQAMRRGTILVGGSVDRLCGWNMLAGTILVFGDCGPECGAGMVRGSIVLAGIQRNIDSLLMPTFARGGHYDQSLFGLITRWLHQYDFGIEEPLFNKPFQMYHGDLLRGGRGEIFIGLS